LCHILKQIKMSENETTVLENVIFYYYGSDGVKYYTPSANFAHKQAENYGTNNVFIEKEEKK
jgi:hypothetical protein